MNQSLNNLDTSKNRKKTFKPDVKMKGKNI